MLCQGELRVDILAMRSKSEKTCRAAGKIETMAPRTAQIVWEGVLERSVRAQPRNPPYTFSKLKASMTIYRKLTACGRQRGRTWRMATVKSNELRGAIWAYNG